MISYKERELLMVMKYMADHTTEFADELASFSDSTSNHKMECSNADRLPEAEDYADIVKNAYEAGYDVNVSINDLLSKEEIDELEARYDEIEKEFKDKTKLNKTDMSFVFIALALQMLRQYFQPSLEFDAFKDGKDRKGNKDTAKDAKDKVDKEKVKEQKAEAEGDKTKGSRYYHAPLDKIANFNYTSYDLTESGKFKELKLGGTNHRFKTLGHDPWLGYFFGTLNILTDTVTMGKEDLFKSYHVGRSDIGHTIPIAEADMNKIMQYGFNRWQESKATVGLAVAHQTYHINSDKLSHAGIPLPFIEVFADSKFIKELTDKGFDYAKLEFAGGVVKQTMFAEIINYVISVAHRLTILYKENLLKADCTKLSIDDLKLSLMKQMTLDEVRTRKIILYSMSMASVANSIIIGSSEYVAVQTGNEKKAEEALKKIDVGGYISTLMHLITDVRFISKVKKDFCAKMIEEDFQNHLKELGISEL